MYKRPENVDFILNDIQSNILDYYVEQLEQENKRLNTILNNIHNYIEKMSYCEVVDNPKKELSRILERDNNI